MSEFIQPFTSENTGDLYPLYFSVYGRRRSAGYYEKKYATIYSGYPPPAFIAYDRAEKDLRLAIGFYGALPCYLFFGGEKVSAAQCADAMTHPAFRRRGLFLKLARQTMDACEKSGIRLLFGFPNQYSLPGFLGKLGWEQADQMACFRLPVPGFPLRKLANRLFITGSSYERYADFILRRYAQDRENAAPALMRTVNSGLLRDEAWLEQKRGAGMRQLTLGQNVCWIRIGEELLVGDITGSPGSLRRNLEGLKKIARRLGLAAVQFHCSPGSALHEALQKEMPAIPSFHVIFKDFGTGLPFRRLQFTLADIDTF